MPQSAFERDRAWQRAVGCCFSQAELLAFCQGGDATISEAFGCAGKLEDPVFKCGGKSMLQWVLGGLVFLVSCPEAQRCSDAPGIRTLMFQVPAPIRLLNSAPNKALTFFGDDGSGSWKGNRKS